MEKIGEINNLIKPVNPIEKKEKIKEKPKERFEDILRKKQEEEEKEQKEV